MAANKKWKRKAKRVKGECIVQENRCFECGNNYLCVKTIGFEAAINVDIRELEKRHKGMPRV